VSHAVALWAALVDRVRGRAAAGVPEGYRRGTTGVPTAVSPAGVPGASALAGADAVCSAATELSILSRVSSSVQWSANVLSCLRSHVT